MPFVGPFPAGVEFWVAGSGLFTAFAQKEITSIQGKGRLALI
jgi:hypothetical protein